MSFRNSGSGAGDSAASATAGCAAPDEVQVQLEPGQSREFAFGAAAACDVHWDITFIGSGSCRFAAGETHTLRLTLPLTASPRSLIRGQIVIRRPDGALLRSIPVCGWVRIPRKTQIKKGARKPPVLKLALSALAVCVAAGLIWRCARPLPPTLIIEPGLVDFGTLAYSPPVNGGFETAIVFTARWKTPPRDLDHPMLIALRVLHIVGDTSPVRVVPFTFSLSNQTNKASVPFLGQGFTGEIARVTGTVSLVLSNAHARVLPAEIRFKAEVRPATGP